MAPVELPQAGRSVSAPLGLGSRLSRFRARWAWFAALGTPSSSWRDRLRFLARRDRRPSVSMNGVMMVVAGAAEISMGLHMKNWGRLILLCAAGALLLLAGVLCVLNPLLAAVALTLCLGAGLCATGSCAFMSLRRWARTRLGGSRCCPALSPSSSA